MQTATSPDVSHGVRQVEIGPERDGQRIDNALMTLLKGVPKSAIYRILRMDETGAVGGCAAWLRQGKHRKEAKRRRQEIDRLETEIETARREAAAARRSSAAALPAPTSQRAA